MNCPLPEGDYFMPAKCVGGDGGRGFLVCKVKKGSLVKKVRVYFDDTRGCIQGIQVTYTDGTESDKRGGGSDSDMTEITLKEGETIKQASLWDKIIASNRSVRIGRITLTTSENRTFIIGREIGLRREYPIEVGSGYLAGFTGYWRTDLIKLGFIFLKPIEKVSISHVKFELPPPEKIPSQQLAQTTFSGDKDMTFTFSNKIGRVNKYCFMSSTTKRFPKNVKVEVGVPKIFKVGGGFAWEPGETESRQWEESTEITLEWAVSGPLKPGESVLCTATCKCGTADIDYGARVTVAFEETRDQWTFSETGTLKTTTFAFATAEAVNSTQNSHADLAPTGGTAGVILRHNTNHANERDEDF